MTLQEVIDLINDYIVENHNQEITGDILNGVLLAMLQQPNELIGDLSDLTTGDNATIVEAINWIVSNLNNGSQVHVGEDNPNVTPPSDFAIGDFYSQIDEFLNPVALYVYTGTSWVNLVGYITKESEQWHNFILSGTGGLPTLVAINENQRFINITGNPSGTSSLGGYHNAGGSIPTSIFWSGMTVKVHNATASDQVIKHNYSSATIKFLFPQEEDYIIKPNETVTFTYRGGALEFEGIYLTAENISFDDTTTQLGVSNTQGAIEKTNERIDNLGTMAYESASDYTKTEDLADVALSNDYNDLYDKPIPLTNEDWTIIIDENNVIWSNISDHTEEFVANGTDRNFVSDVDFASIGAVYINGVKIKRDDYLVISESEIEIKETVTLLENDFVEIFGSIFVIEPTI